MIEKALKMVEGIAISGQAAMLPPIGGGNMASGARARPPPMPRATKASTGSATAARGGAAAAGAGVRENMKRPGVVRSAQRAAGR